MPSNRARITTLALACTLTAVALGMAGVGAWQRADDLADRVLLVALSGVVVMAVHLLPALCRGWLVWPLWAVCFAVAVFGHAGFFAFAGVQAAQSREAASTHTQALRERQDAVKAALESIKARPVAVVAGQLARQHTPKRRQALELELTEARRAAALRDELVTLSGQRADRAVTEGVTDPVTQAVARVWGLPAQTVALVMSLVTAALVELLGMVLWREALRPEQTHADTAVTAVAPLSVPTDTTPTDPADTADTADPLQELREALARGAVKPTVTGIRQHLKCNQARAAQIRRELVA